MKSKYSYPNTPKTDEMLSGDFEMITSSDIRAIKLSMFTQEELYEIAHDNPYKVVGRICLYCGNSSIRFWNDHCDCDRKECHHFRSVWELKDKQC